MPDCMRCGLKGGADFTHACTPGFTIIAPTPWPSIDVPSMMEANGVLAERTRILARLRARATAEEVTADRWAHGGDDRMVALHRKVAEVLREECDRIEMGL